ncbi:hypothetical protein V2A60_002597 [Cordyceps javanica]
MPAMDSDAPPPSYDSSISMNNDADILFQTAYKNQIWSPLLRLPDKLLVLLMKSLDLDTLLRLRHTSRVFMWLFNSEAAFEKYHLKLQQDNDRFNDTARVWTPPSAWFKDQAISGFRRMCPPCRVKRQGDQDGPYLALGRDESNNLFMELWISQSSRSSDCRLEKCAPRVSGRHSKRNLMA